MNKKYRFKPLLIALLIGVASQAEAQSNPFDYSFDDVSDHILLISCTSEQGKSSGSGFVAKQNGKTYIYTNQHVILGADKISFKTASGEALRPSRIELSITRDIARLTLKPDSPGLEIAQNTTLDAPIGIFGNSEGAGVATELYGKVTGIGTDIIEVDADFVSGNSGSPLLNLNKEVIGIASYVRVASDDEDGTETRRFCYRVADSRWKTVKWKFYNDKYGKLYRNSEQLIDSIFELASGWYEEPFSRMSADEHPDAGLRKWSTSHNRTINKINRLLDKGTATQHELDNTNKQVRKDMNDSADALSVVCRSRARQMRMFAKQKELTGFLKDEYISLADRMDYAAVAIEKYGAELGEYNFFSFN